MKNYEIVLLLNTTSEVQYKKIIEKYLLIIKNHGGIIHRLENWGRRELAYSIKKINKAYYSLINIECKIDLINELKNNFKLNSYIIRNIILNIKKAIKEPSIIMNNKQNINKV
ncbi:30S ribosomal protein S6 [endosymbiont of Pachyrhynchus infernalis]|uniref:30S ribosomal protein S6 n=1 Tax=endosymbiont of Pachyrhynchus infernalis TaxID=1971488 RepID=UPI000DC73E3D|nr:30S ribosomal protein S6 [endosymbiont of Pachyrhynchus infernalis]BBA84934.1 30S ribosomal protein S6 [endosymbiont of Pachyrhynchus infernalis]